MAWALRRLKASPCLRVDCILDWNFEKPWASIARLQQHVEAATAASGDFQCLKLLVNKQLRHADDRNHFIHLWHIKDFLPAGCCWHEM